MPMTIVGFLTVVSSGASALVAGGRAWLATRATRTPFVAWPPMEPLPQTSVPLAGRLQVPAQAEASRRPARYAICSTCHGPAAPSRRQCWSCAVVGSRLGSLPPVVPVFVFGLGTPVHGALVGYKAGATASGRAVRAAALAEVLGEWLERHAACLLGDAGEAMLVPVPSSAGGRASWHGRHPLEGLCASAAPRSGRLRPEPVLLPGPEPPRRLQASRRGFVVENPGSLSGRTALVVDDMFVSGSRILSAAAALTDAGVRVTAAVPIGRLVRPDHNAATYAYWGDRSATPFDPAICPRCAPGRGRRRVSAFGTGLASVSQRLAA